MNKKELELYNKFIDEKIGYLLVEDEIKFKKFISKLLREQKLEKPTSPPHY